MSPLAGATIPWPQAAESGEVSRALEALVSRFDAFIRRTASRQGLTGPELDEVVQDLRIRLWKAGEAPGGIRSANAVYIRRTAHSASVDLIRRSRSRNARVVSLDVVEPTPATTPGRPDQDLEAADLAAEVDRALEQVQPSRRVAVRLYLAGYDRFEIAAAQGWTEGRARNLLYRGLEDLRRALGQRGITVDS